MRIVIVEDSITVQQMLVEHLEAEAGFSVVGCAAGADEAVALVLRTLPDLVLLDLHLSPGSGLAVLAELRERGFSGRISILSADEPATYGSFCIARGADGYHDKADIDALIAGLRSLEQASREKP